MILMNLKANNLYSFNDFHINFAYPKKLLNSTVADEFIIARPNFRYKKINLLMGSNASGKTTLGRLLMGIFNFLENGQNWPYLEDAVYDKNKTASISLDLVLSDLIFYRIDIQIETENIGEDQSYKICVRKTNINTYDDYESCVEKVEKQQLIYTDKINEELSKINKKLLGWSFSFPSTNLNVDTSNLNKNLYCKILENILRTLDPSIKKVEQLNTVEDSYIIWMKEKKLLMQEGKLALNNILSSGTSAGIEIAAMLTEIIENKTGFYYSDERFSYVNSDIEVAIISLMIEKLGNDSQLFITTHNSDVLDMNLPKHSFTFLRKDSEGTIKAAYASDYLKKNTASLKNAVINDVFSTAPRLNLLDELA